MSRKSGYRFSDKDMRHSNQSRVRPDSNGTGRALAELGSTPHEIMSITGHRTLEEVEEYTRAAQMKGLSDIAMARLKR